MKRKKEEGITLIALVITIIILLILAGVTIAALSGDNGILKNAAKAKEETKQAEDLEQKKLAQTEAIIHTTETQYNGVTIPAQCAPTRIYGENTVDEGLVIIDKNGNEWVWIEVPKEITSKANTDSDIETALQEYVGTIVNNKDGYEDIWYAYDNGKIITSNTENLTTEQKNLNNGCGLTYEEYNNKKSLMLNSIKNNGGFYIGRYEVGYELKEGENARNYDTDYSSKHTTEQTPVIKSNSYPYNWVRCSQAEELSESLAIGNKTSSLMFGIQWDLVIKFLSEKNVKNIDDIILDSSNWSNYSKSKLQITNTEARQSIDNGATYTMAKNKSENTNTILTAGATEDTRILNIYDLSGNMWERTLEKSPVSYNPCTVRGGCFRTTQTYSACTRGNDGITYSTYDTGFRATLY